MKLPPQDLEAEKFIIGCCIIDSVYIGNISEVISEDDFYDILNAEIFAQCKKLYVDGNPVDMVSVNSALQNNKIYKDRGGFKYIEQVIDTVQTVAGWQYHANTIREKSLLRKTIKVIQNTASEIDSGEMSAKDILEKCQSDMFGVANSQQSKNSLKHVESEVLQSLKDIEYVYANKSAVPGLASGFAGLDKKIGGFSKGELIIIAGRPSMGKTAFALNVAEKVANTGKAVAIFSLEMSRRLLTNRLLSSVSSLANSKLKYGNIETYEFQYLAQGAEKLSKMPIYIDDSADMTVLDIRTRARNTYNQIKAKGQELSLILIDYIQLMKGDPKLKDKNLQVADISRQLKTLAKDLDIPVVALSQLSRAVEQRGINNTKPMLSDLRDSGAIEQDADVVLFVWREGYYKKNEPALAKNATIIVGKNRNGACGEVKLLFEAELTKFFDNN